MNATKLALNVLIVDDEPLARKRLRTLLQDCTQPMAIVGGEASNTADALALLEQVQFDAVLLDIHMPGGDGLALARSLKTMAHIQKFPPAIVFITAHAEHAVDAFDLTATDYLTKPVRLERLQNSLQKIEQHKKSISRLETNSVVNNDDFLIIQDRGMTQRLPVSEVLYLKAELKYISVRTAVKTHILEGSLNDLEARFPSQFLRIHRNALVSTQAMRALEKHFDHDEGECWAVRLAGVDELLMVSRRQLGAVKDVISK